MMRHGEAVNNVQHILSGRHGEYHLTEKGRQQASDAADKLSTLSIDAVYSSPVLRAVETAQIASQRIGKDYKIDERLTETEMGSLTEAKYHDVLHNHGDFFLKFYQNDGVLAGVGVEKFSAIGERVNSMLDYVAEKHHDKNVLLVTHLDPIKAAIIRTTDLTPHTLLAMSIRNASLTILKHGSKDYSLVAFNATDMP